MAYGFPKAYDAHMQLLYDRHDSLFSSDNLLIEKIVVKFVGDPDEFKTMLDEIVANRPKSDATARELLKYQFYGLRLRTLLGFEDPNGIFKTTVPYDPELQKELENGGNWFVRVAEDKKTMEISTLSF